MNASGSPQKVLRAWYLYDWANSAFATTVMAAVLPPYFARVAADNLPSHVATAYWGYATSAFLLLAAVISPLIGAHTDQTRSPRRTMAIAIALGCLATAVLGTVGSGDWMRAILAFGIAFLGFTSANVVYDGLLLVIAPVEKRDRVSARGFAWGYAGGGLLLAIHAAWIVKPEFFGFADAGAASRMAFLTVAFWWALFSIPILRSAPSPPAGPSESFRHPFSRLRETLSHPGRLRETWKFLAAFWLYNDGIGTVIKMSTVYGASLGFGTGHLVGALLLVQILAIPSTLAAGWLSRRVGARAVVLAGLAIYVVVGLLGFFMTRPLHFWILAALVATAQGGVQALSRSLFTRLVPQERAAEMFGFYSVSQKFAGLFGPLFFGLVSHVTGNPRLGALTILPFLILGGLVLTRVRIPQERVAD
jgi:UMF1 family MFS transporter